MCIRDRPESPPPLHMFVKSMETAPENELKIIDQIQDDTSNNDDVIKTDTKPIPIPEDGLPEGWSEEQWQHYGQQYLDSI